MNQIVNAIVKAIKKGLKKNPVLTIAVLLLAAIVGYFLITKTPLGENLGLIPSTSISESDHGTESEKPTSPVTTPAETEATVGETDGPTEAEPVQPTETAPPETSAPTTSVAPTETEKPSETQASGITVQEGTRYKDKDHVALYIHLYGKLPPNYMTKSQAEKEGGISKIYKADSTKMASIGGDNFGNREGLLPKKSGRTWTECDIDYTGGSRNAKRIVFSNDGLIYYTDDHYESFTQLY